LDSNILRTATTYDITEKELLIVVEHIITARITVSTGTEFRRPELLSASPLPVFRLYNAVQIAVDFGQRGALENGFFKDDTGLIREYYFNLHVSFSLHDIWFLKVLYD
jgi:hypothetical protein